MEVLAVIAARGGSKGIPGKNTRPLHGQPLIYWTIRAAHAAKSVTRTVFSTDDEAIAGIARRFGAEVPFLRPAALAEDDSTATDVVLHLLAALEDEGYQPDSLLWLQPTSPFRHSGDIDQAVAMLEASPDADGVVGVYPVKAHPFWMKMIDRRGRLRDWQVDQNQVSSQRQHLPEVYITNGAIYLVRLSAFQNQRTFYPAETLAYVMPQERSVDIDTPWDFRIAEMVAGDFLSGDFLSDEVTG